MFGIREPRKGGKVLRADLSMLVAADLSEYERFDFDPLTPNQVDHRSIPTQQLFVGSPWRLGNLLCEAFLLLLSHGQGRLPCAERRTSRRGLAHLDP